MSGVSYFCDQHGLLGGLIWLGFGARGEVKWSLKWSVVSAKRSLGWLHFGGKCSLERLYFFEHLTFQGIEIDEMAA